MRRAWLHINRTAARDAGFSVVEVLLAAVVFATLTTGVIGAIVYGRSATDSAGDRAQAYLLAEEGIDATRNIADAAYANLTTGNHGLTISGGQWAFSGTSDVDPSGVYTRVINVAAGTNRQTVTSTVSWTMNGSTSNVTLTTEISNWAATLKSWGSATASSATNGAGVTPGANAGIKTATQGKYAYTVLDLTGVNNFIVTDLTTNTNVAAVNYGGAGKPQNIVVRGDYAYIASTTDSKELVIMDISNPLAPTVLSTLDLTSTGDGKGLYLSGNYLYEVRVSDTTAGADEFNVIDVSNPAAPVFKGGVDDNISMNEVYVWGNYAFVATTSTTQEMLVFNVVNPAAPTLIGTYNAPTASSTLTIAGLGNVIYLGTGTAFDIVTVTNLPTPTFTLTGTFTANGTINDLDVDITDKYAFLGTSLTTASLQVVNIATPSAPTIAKAVTTTVATRGVAYSPLDVVAMAANSTTQQVAVAKRN